MNSLGSKIVVLLVLLGQAVASLGFRQRAFFIPATDAHHAAHHGSHDPAQTPHAHDHCDHHADVHLFPWTSDALPGDDCAARCCPCPHVHMQVKDAPLAVRESRGVKDEIPSKPLPVPVSSVDDRHAIYSSQPNWRWTIRHLEADHPPPPGVSTTRLVI